MNLTPLLTVLAAHLPPELLATWQTFRAGPYGAYALPLGVLAAGGVLLLLAGTTTAGSLGGRRDPVRSARAFASPAPRGQTGAAERSVIGGPRGANTAPNTAPQKLHVWDAARVVKQAAKAARPVWAADLLFGTHTVAILSAAPKLGKTYAVMGLLRAMQDGASFFGLTTTPLRVLYCTEQNAATFGALLQQFGVSGKAVQVVHRDSVRGWDWPLLVRELAKQAKRRKCRGLILDTLAAWCPTAEQGPEAVEAALGPLQALTAEGFAVLLIHHDRKAGGSHGANLRGHSALAGAVDILCSLERGRLADERVLIQYGRYGERRLVARLDGVRYITAAAPIPATDRHEKSGSAGTNAPDKAAVLEDTACAVGMTSTAAPPRAAIAPTPPAPQLTPEQHAILDALDTLERLPDAPGVPFMMLQRALGVPKATLHDRLRALKAQGLATTVVHKRTAYWTRA